MEIFKRFCKAILLLLGAGLSVFMMTPVTPAEQANAWLEHLKITPSEGVKNFLDNYLNFPILIIQIVSIVFLFGGLMWIFWPKIIALGRISIDFERCKLVETKLSSISQVDKEWLIKMVTGARPIGITDDIWRSLENTGLVERDFIGPKGILPDFLPAITAWLERNK